MRSANRLLCSVCVFVPLLASIACGGSTSSTPLADADAGVDAGTTHDDPNAASNEDESDAGPTVSSNEPTWCETSKHAFCADFDGAELFAGWDSMPATSFDAFDTAPWSAPNGLILIHSGAPLELAKHLSAGDPAGIRVSFDIGLLASDLDASQTETPVAFELTHTVGGEPVVVAGVRFDVRKTKSTLVSYGADESDAAFSEAMNPQLAFWSRLDLTVKSMEGGLWVSADLLENGADRHLATVQLPDFDDEVDGVNLRLGALSSNSGKSASIVFDNVTVDVP